MPLSGDANLGNRDEVSFPAVPHRNASDIQKRQPHSVQDGWGV